MTDTQRAACTGMTDLVDAAFDHPKSPAGTRLRTQVCPTCPIWADCLTIALDHGEHGSWGGLSERERRSNLKARRPFTANLAGLHDHAGPAFVDRYAVLDRVGVTSREIKTWAMESGLVETVRLAGSVSFDLIDAYLEAHHLTAA